MVRAEKMMRAEKIIIDTETLLDFLVPFDKQVAHSKPAGDQGQQSAVARAKKFTVQVICR